VEGKHAACLETVDQLQPEIQNEDC